VFVGESGGISEEVIVYNRSRVPFEKKKIMSSRSVTSASGSGSARVLDSADNLKAATRIPQLVAYIEMECCHLDDIATHTNLAAQSRHAFAQSLIFANKSIKEKSVATPNLFSKDKRKSNVLRKHEFVVSGVSIWNEFRSNLFDTEIDQSLLEAHALEEFAKQVLSIAQDVRKDLSEIQESLEKERMSVFAEREKASDTKLRKNCAKQYDILKENIKKLIHNKQTFLKITDQKKKEKMSQTLARMESDVEKEKAQVFALFKQLEDTVSAANSKVLDFFVSNCGIQKVEKLKKLIELKSARFSECFLKLVEKKKGWAENIVQNLTEIEEKGSSNLSESGFNQVFNGPEPEKSAVDTFTPPAEVALDLPCSSDALEKSIKALLNSNNSGLSQSLKPINQSSQTPRASDVEFMELTDPSQDDVSLKIISKAIALYAYNAVDSTQLSFNEGEIIFITDQSDEYWWGGFLESDPEKSEKWFPSDYIQIKD
jgi:hypothetical protein